jgi:hypothetical protein
VEVSVVTKKLSLGIVAASGIAALALSLTARADVVADLQARDATNGVNPAMPNEMVKFTDDGARLDFNYSRALSAKVHQIVQARTRQMIKKLLTSPCQDWFKADFMEPGFAGIGNLNDVQKEFEEDLMRVEGVACLSHGTPEKAMQVFLSKDYRRKAMPQVKEFSMMGDRILTETKKVPAFVAATRSWMKTYAFNTSDVSVLLGQIDGNAPEFQPIFYREANTVFVKLPQGGVAAYTLNYMRGENIGNIWHGTAKGKLEDTQKKAFEVLEQELAR